MAADYRDELAAAHARIAELTEKIASLEADAARTSAVPADGAFPELEAAVARRRAAADPKRNERQRVIVSLIAASFPMLGLVFTLQHSPLAATLCSAIFIALTVASFVLRSRLKAATRALEDAEQRLADARKMRELERKLAAATHAAATARVRVDASADTAEAVESGPNFARSGR